MTKDHTESLGLRIVTQYRALRTGKSLMGKLANGAWWSLLGAVASQGLGQIAFLVVARHLNTAGCGALGMVLNTVGVFGLVAGMGMGLTATKAVASLRTSDPRRTGRIIRLLSLMTVATGGLASMAAYQSSPFVSVRFLNAPALSDELRVACLLLFFNTLNGVQTGVLTGLEAFKRTAQLNLVKGLITVPLIITGATLWGLHGAVCSYVAASAFGCALNGLVIRRECREFGIPLAARGIWAERRVLWDFAIPSFLGGLVLCPAMWAASALLVNQPRGYESAGLFTAADKWRLLITFVPSATAASVLSLLSSEAAKPGSAGYRRLFRANLAVGVALTLPATISVMLFSSQLMALSGEAFRQGSVVLSLLALSAVPSLLNVTFGQVLVSAGKMWQRAFIDVLLGVVLLALAMWLVPLHGAPGLAAAYVLAYSVAAALLMLYTYRHPELPAFRCECSRD